MVYPADIPDLSNTTPSHLDNSGGTPGTKVHSQLHKELADNLEPALNMLGLPDDQSTSTVLGRLNNLENYPQVEMLENGVNKFLDSDVGGYLLVAQRSAGTTPIVFVPTGQSYVFLDSNSAASGVSVSGRELTMPTQFPHPVLIVKDPTGGQNFWYVAVLGAAEPRTETTLTWPTSTSTTAINFTHNLGTEEVLCTQRGVFNDEGGFPGLETTVTVPVRPVNTNQVQFGFGDYPPGFQPIRNTDYHVVLRAL